MRTAPEADDRYHTAWFIAAIASGAFLLFQIQPMIGKAILPWFGGSSSVWTSCMLFFQIALLAGYGYAHLLSDRVAARTQLIVHLSLLVTAIVFLPVLPSAAWKPDGPEGATLRIVLLLAATVGVPFLMLASTGPLLQAWFARRFPGRAPYRLYAVSNAASLAALVSYPFVVEPRLGLQAQAWAWSAGYLLFAISSGGCAWVAWRASRPVSAEAQDVEAPSAPPPTGPHGPAVALLWAAPAACGVVLFLAVTNQLCLNLANVPFLWILPLTVYLVSFIAAFAGEGWYPRRVMLPISVVAVVTIASITSGRLELPWREPIELSLPAVIALFAIALFVLCFALHGELYRLRPETGRLTGYYLAISAGGAAGGLFVGIVAPLVFIMYQELQVGLLAACLTLAVLVWRDGSMSSPALRRLALGGVAVAWIGLVLWFAAQRADLLQTAIWSDRNFYGTTRVLEVGSVRAVMHGSTVHGAQETSERGRRIPTTYYTPDSAPALVLNERRARGPLVIGVVGLGAGTLAAYCEPGDRFRFYELDPNMIRVAREWFSFVGDCEARGGIVEIVPGDARLSIERELSEGRASGYDLLILDAFSSDAIPVHLLTEEAFALYEQAIAADGVIAIHVTNRHLDLRPVVAGSAASIEFEAWHAATPGGGAGRPADWIVLARASTADGLDAMRRRGARLSIDAASRWTDRSSDLFSVLR